MSIVNYTYSVSFKSHRSQSIANYRRRTPSRSKKYTSRKLPRPVLVTSLFLTSYKAPSNPRPPEIAISSRYRNHQNQNSSSHRNTRDVFDNPTFTFNNHHNRTLRPILLRKDNARQITPSDLQCLVDIRQGWLFYFEWHEAVYSA